MSLSIRHSSMRIKTWAPAFAGATIWMKSSALWGLAAPAETTLRVAKTEPLADEMADGLLAVHFGVGIGGNPCIEGIKEVSAQAEFDLSGWWTRFRSPLFLKYCYLLTIHYLPLLRVRVGWNG